MSQPLATFPSAVRFSVRQLALLGVFALLGLFMGSWASRIATIRDVLHISHAALSSVLLCGGIGAVLSSTLASKAVTRFGSGKTLYGAGFGLCLVLPGVGFAPSLTWLMLAVGLLGLLAGAFGIALNLVASQHERATGSASMSTFYAAICIGSLSGALLGSAIADHRISPGMHFTGIAMLAAAVLWHAALVLGVDASKEFIRHKTFSLPKGPLALLGVLSFCGALAQNSIADWSGVFLKDHLRAAGGVAPLALSAYTGMMLLARLLGDRLRQLYGARLLVSIGGLVAAGGLLLAMQAPSAYLAIAGFGLAGLGLSFLFPFVFSAAGQESATASASVASMANLGGLIGPPAVGLVASAFGMQAVIGLLALLSLVIALTAAKASILNKRQA